MNSTETIADRYRRVWWDKERDGYRWVDLDTYRPFVDEIMIIKKGEDSEKKG